MTKIIKEPTGSFSPFYGCAIMAMAAMLFGGIISWSAYSFLKQDSEIAKFTVDQPAPLARQSLPAADQAAFKAKLNTFAEAATAGKPATLTLSIAELNTLIELAPDTGYGNYKDMIAFKALKPGDTLMGDVCLPFNTAKFWEDKKRYAIGEAAFVLDITKEAGPDLHVTALSVPGKTVNDGFIQTLSSSRWLTPYQKLPALAPTLKAIKKATVTAEGVVLSTTP
ncbi:MAG: hypothetical protein JWO89_3349 [Verrucomicrobiaceae bacterium]|nr:hypothetical protein [Verrucomicrobiaceae bacterium]MDB6119800.1 hypothetical protein [Verrucomicrobiaceae bacterium]